MRSRVLFCVGLFVWVAAGWLSQATAEPLSQHDALHVAPSGLERLQGVLDAEIYGGESDFGSRLEFSGRLRDSGFSASGISGILAPSGALSVVVDHSTATPSSGGLAFSPNDSFQIEARGTFQDNLQELGGQLMLHFRF